MSLPNFIIFGTRKAGTSSLYHYLSQHPQIFMSPIKGSRYFLFDPENPPINHNIHITTLKDYENMFAAADPTRIKAIGEASPSYMYSIQASRRIKQTTPNIRLVASLRNPVDMIYSLYQMKARNLKASSLVPFNMDNISYWGDSGLYYKYLKCYFDTFPRHQLKILIFEEWISNPAPAMKDIFTYLGVDVSFLPNFKARYNTGGLPNNQVVATILRYRSKFISIKPFVPMPFRSLINRIINSNMEKAPPLEPEMRHRLLRYFYTDILSLQDLLQKDLSCWLTETL